MTARPLLLPWRWPGLLLGFALGGFFDGILLHQILQWHHLLSNVDAVRDLRLQILADGLFHALMYLIALGALVRLWRSRAAAATAGAGRWLAGHALAGFGAWHGVDGVLSHWLLGLHRIRMDTAAPWAWDLGWFVVLGLVPLMLGRWWARSGGRAGPGGGRAVAAGLAVVVAVAGAVTTLPVGRSDPALVVFAPGVSPGEAFNALARADARVLWADRSGGLWAVALPPGFAAGPLYRSGALWVTGSAAAFGCAAWTRVPG